MGANRSTRPRARYTRRASLTHLVMGDEKYSLEVDGKKEPIDLVTTSLDSRMPLRTDLRTPAGDNQVPFNDLD